MAYPPAPGTSNLPARPPPPASGNNGGGGFNKSGFKPAFGAAPQSGPQQPSYPRTSTPTYAASSTSTRPSSYGPTAPPQPQNSYQQQAQYGPSYPSYPGGGRGGAPGSMTASAPYSYQQNQPQSYGPSRPSYGTSSYSAAPQIRNPFPATSANSDYDPEMAAQIAQWQSAYTSRDEPVLGRDGKPIATADAPKPELPAAVAASGNPDKKKTVMREGGGKKWTDETLLEWDPSHLRLFVGNLAGETTDDSLLKAFSGWSSVQKARVVRDKRTTKSKGFGFVSFSDADDFFQAAKAMHGKYIQSHPVVVRKANTDIKVSDVKEKDRGGKNKKKGGNNHNKNNGAGGGYEPKLGPMGGGGVTKPGQKTKNGLKLLG